MRSISRDLSSNVVALGFVSLLMGMSSAMAPLVASGAYLLLLLRSMPKATSAVP